MKLSILLSCVAALVLSGCATSPTGRSQLMLVSDQQMDQMGLAAFNELRTQGKFANAPRDRAYATCVADALIRHLPSPFSQQKWDVQIIDDDTANAFALPGGRIGVHKGMFKVATTQDQLAVVLGHELAHVVAHHAAERVSDNLAVQTGVAAAGAYGASKGANPDIITAALGLGSQVGILLPFSRTQESEADMLGLRYMAAAGFDPHAAPTLWEKMASSGGSAPSAFLSTHPAPGKRAQTLARQADSLMPVYQEARAAGNTPKCAR